MKKVDKVLSVIQNRESDVLQKEILSFKDYLSLVLEQPWVTRNTVQLLHDMILSEGVEYTIATGKPLKHKYTFFESGNLVSDKVVFGQQRAKENLVEKVRNASKGLEASKRLWILLGPPGSAKSRSMDGIKMALNKYSKSDDGKTYTLLIPTVDARLKDRALFEEDGIYYLQSPIFERPLQIIPLDNRKEFLAKLNEEIDHEGLKEFYERAPHYDNDFRVTIDGIVSPYCTQILKDFAQAKDIEFDEVLTYLKVKRMIFDQSTKTGIGTYTPRDEKSQESGSLVGNIDYSLLPKFGSESHPLVHDYKGELCVGANGFVEIHEILKLSDKFLYEMLFATQDRFFSPEGQPPIPFNGVIIGHTNFHEYNMFMENESFEALRSRTTFIEMPLSVDFNEERRIYELTYSNETRDWNTEKKNTPHVAPHGLTLLSLVAVMSRLAESKQNQNISLLQKALVYSGRADSGVDNNMAKMLIDEFEYEKPAEGTFGLDPRFIQNVFENTEHFQINEYIANIQKLLETDEERSLLASTALRNPCVTPVDLYVSLERHVKEKFTNKPILNKYANKILPAAKEWIFSQIASDVYEAILQDDTIVENTWKKYCQHFQADVLNSTVQHEITHESARPDETFMSAIELYLGIPDKETFRKELSDAISSVGYDILLGQEPSYQAAIKKYVFENEFKSKENMKLLGWLKSGSSSANSNTKEQEHLNETIKYLVDEKKYCGKCAHQALIITANASSVTDVE